MSAPSWIHESHDMERVGDTKHWSCTKCKITTSERSAATVLKLKCGR